MRYFDFFFYSCIQNHKNCLKFIIHILKFNNVIKDALRELGFIEVLIARLHHFAALLKESVQDPNGKTKRIDNDLVIIIFFFRR